MMYDLARTERIHRAINAETTPISLLKQKCVCGKPAHAKQLVQYGVCIACQLAARVASLQPEDFDILRFMLGVKQSPRATWGNRNTYLCNRRDQPSMARLVKAGFVRAGGQVLQLRYYHATGAGAKLAGLNGAAIRRAMGDRP